MAKLDRNPGVELAAARAARWRWVAVSLALATFMVGVAAVGVGAPPFPHEPDDVCDELPEGESVSYRTSASLWPPGAIDCEYKTAEAVRQSTYLPWVEWLSVALFSIGVGLGSTALARLVSRRPLRLYSGAALLLSAMAIWFLGLERGLVIGLVLGGVALLVIGLGRRLPTRHAPRADGT